MANYKREYKDRENFVMNKGAQLLNGLDQLLGNLQMCFKDMTQEEIQATENQLLFLVHQINERGNILVQYRMNAESSADLWRRDSQVHQLVALSYGRRLQVLPSPPSDQGHYFHKNLNYIYIKSMM
jgi:hypothetical protein